MFIACTNCGDEEDTPLSSRDIKDGGYASFYLCEECFDIYTDAEQELVEALLDVKN